MIRAQHFSSDDFPSRNEWERDTWNPEIIVDDLRPARLEDMSWPTADITVEPQPEYEPRPRVRSHEVPRSYGKTTPAEWFWLVTGLMLCAAWVGALLIAMYAVTVG